MRTALALLLFTATGFVAAADPSVRAYALNVNNPPAGAPKEIVSPPYTGVYLFVEVPGKHVLALDAAGTKLALTDDKGTDLAAKSPLPASAFAADKSREHARLYVLGAKAPAAGATRARVKGELVLLCGTGEKTASAEKFALKEKEKVTVGPATFEVTLVKDKQAVALKSEGAAVKSVAFTDAAGKALAAGGTLALSTAGGKASQTATFVLPPKTDAVNIKVTYYEKVEPLKVPVDTDTGVGP